MIDMTLDLVDMTVFRRKVPYKNNGLKWYSNWFLNKRRGWFRQSVVDGCFCVPFRAEPFLGTLELVKRDGSERLVWALWEVWRYLLFLWGAEEGVCVGGG